ncbi:MAG: hypothetical protein V3R84_10490 [Acidimicrobiia bacterium]
MEKSSKTPFGIANLSGLLAALWVVLAWLNPDLTYHLAPILVAGAFPIGHRARVSQPLNPVQAFATFVGASLNVGVATGILAWADKLRGPSLLPTGGAVMEAVIFGALAAAAMAVVAALPLRFLDSP